MADAEDYRYRSIDDTVDHLMRRLSRSSPEAAAMLSTNPQPPSSRGSSARRIDEYDAIGVAPGGSFDASTGAPWGTDERRRNYEEQNDDWKGGHRLRGGAVPPLRPLPGSNIEDVVDRLVVETQGGGAGLGRHGMRDAAVRASTDEATRRRTAESSPQARHSVKGKDVPSAPSPASRRGPPCKKVEEPPSSQSRHGPRDPAGQHGTSPAPMGVASSPPEPFPANAGASAVASPSHRQPSIGNDTAAQQDLVLRRMAFWQSRKEANRATKKREVDLVELAECTFAPNVDRAALVGGGAGYEPAMLAASWGGQRRQEAITSSAAAHLHLLLAPNPLYKDNHAWGFDTFVDRYDKARRQREEAEAYAQQVFNKPAGHRSWQPGAVTVPQPFALGPNRLRPPIRPGGGACDVYDDIAEVVRREFLDPPSRIERPSVPCGMFSDVTSNAFLPSS